MTLGGVVPDWLLSITAAATLFVLMLDLGIAIVPLEFRWVLQRPALIARALFSVLIAVPALVMLIIAAFRLLVVIEQGYVWAAWLTLGGIFVIAGAFCWTKRNP